MQFVHFKWIFLFMALIVAVNADDFRYNISYFEVPVDHFGFANNKTFKIRYDFKLFSIDFLFLRVHCHFEYSTDFI